MTPPVVPFSVWILGAFDPILILIACYLGWKADQLGKVFIAAIAALGVSALAAWAITSVGLPWLAPVSRDAPMLFPVRTIAAVLWASAAYGARRASRR
jgi:chromate transport protein ChrA